MRHCLTLVRGNTCRAVARVGGKSRLAVARRAASTNEDTQQPLKRTALFNLHKELGGKMVPFCGWEMPVSYAGQSIIESHMHTRTRASLFDVSHMCQLRFTGEDRVDQLEALVPSDLAGLPVGTGRLTCLTLPWGGILDDTMVTRNKDHVHMVVNAACADKDLEHLRFQVMRSTDAGYDVQLHTLSEHQSLLALQGPEAAAVLRRCLEPKQGVPGPHAAGSVAHMAAWPFLQARALTLTNGVRAYITRCGYTGEDGFEIGVSHDAAVDTARLLLSHEGVQPAGLGARDTLRTEAGLCLYGSDMDEDTNPVEASLAWLIGTNRREGTPFMGADHILPMLATPKLCRRKRVGIKAHRVPQPGSTLVDPATGEAVGRVTSGTFSPILKEGIGMAYVNKPFHKLGTGLAVELRGGKMLDVKVSKMPFVPTRYHQVKE